MKSLADLLTIALPVYKRTDFVKSALDSAVKQTIPCRILLIDNNSPHNDFRDIVESYKNPLLTYHRNPETVPQDENFNNCFRYAETPWVTILHDDDMLHCQFVETAQRIMEKNVPDFGGFAVRCEVGEKEWDGIYIKKARYASSVKKIMEPFYYFAQLTPFPGVVIKSQTALNLGGFSNKLFPIADFDFWYRYNKVEKMFMVEDKLAYYRISSSQSTVEAFYDMINKIYQYRKDLVEKGSYNNFITRLSLEYARKTNIEYFKNTYTAFTPDNNILNQDSLEKAEKIIRFPLVKRFLWKYIQVLSYEKEFSLND